MEVEMEMKGWREVLLACEEDRGGGGVKGVLE